LTISAYHAVPAKNLKGSGLAADFKGIRLTFYTEAWKRISKDIPIGKISRTLPDNS